jgi:hypothetical protein
MKKLKALNVLVTTVLLVVISVSLIMILLAWGRNFTTTGVNTANELVNQKCDKATIQITDCVIIDDGNVLLTIKNTSSQYNYDSSDALLVSIYNDSGTMDPEKEITLSSGTWNGLEGGETIMANIEPTSPELTEDSGAWINVTLRSTICPLAATTNYGCHR